MATKGYNDELGFYRDLSKLLAPGDVAFQAEVVSYFGQRMRGDSAPLLRHLHERVTSLLAKQGPGNRLAGEGEIRSLGQVDDDTFFRSIGNPQAFAPLPAAPADNGRAVPEPQAVRSFGDITDEDFFGGVKNPRLI
ncbi:MAG: hypothetical protein AB1640_07270 [bacterium]